MGRGGPPRQTPIVASRDRPKPIGERRPRRLPGRRRTRLSKRSRPAANASLTRKLSRDGGDAEEAMRDGMAKVREIATQFPRLRARLGTAAADYGAAPNNSFEFGLQALLDGLEAQLTDLRPAPGEHAPVTVSARK